MTKISTNPVDDELDKIIEGFYRWTIDTINKAIEASKYEPKQLILGTGSAPLLSPSEAKAALLAWRSQGVAEAEIALARKVLAVSGGHRKMRGLTQKKRLEILTKEMLKIIPRDESAITEEMQS